MFWVVSVSWTAVEVDLPLVFSPAPVILVPPLKEEPTGVDISVTEENMVFEKVRVVF